MQRKCKKQKAPNPKYPGDPGHNEKTKPKDNKNRKGQRISIKRHSKYFQKIVEENFHTIKKEMTLSIKATYKTQRDWTRKEILPNT